MVKNSLNILLHITTIKNNLYLTWLQTKDLMNESLITKKDDFSIIFFKETT